MEWSILILSSVVSLAVGFSLGCQYLRQRYDAARTIIQFEPCKPAEAGSIDATLHSAILEILAAAWRTPAMSHRRHEIEEILSESGFDMRDCPTGRCRTKLHRNRTFKGFVKNPVNLP